MAIDLRKLSEPFPSRDIEWRVSRAGKGRNGIFCNVLAYITARAIQQRLDEVCGPENWRNEAPQIVPIGEKTVAFIVGISIKIGTEWVTKWDVSEPTNIEPAKGGFSGGMKRAGAQWGIGRYLYHLDEVFAEVAEKSGGPLWNYGKAKDEVYYWKTPTLPGWALPKEKEHEITADELKNLKKSWREKFAATEKNPASLSEGFSRFVRDVCGDFPVDDVSCWTKFALARCHLRIAETVAGSSISGDVPFAK
jgi:hypothetical protein